MTLQDACERAGGRVDDRNLSGSIVLCDPLATIEQDWRSDAKGMARVDDDVPAGLVPQTMPGEISQVLALGRDAASLRKSRASATWRSSRAFRASRRRESKRCRSENIDRRSARLRNEVQHGTMTVPTKKPRGSPVFTNQSTAGSSYDLIRTT